MMDRISNAPINLYFDITPVSRILGYFNEDLGLVDSFVVDYINTVLWRVFGFSTIIFLTIQHLPYMTIFLIILACK